MNIYKKKITWKFALIFFAVGIGIGSLWYTNKLVKELANEERKKVILWAEATRLIPREDIEGESLDFLFSVIQFNETVPVILVGSDTTIIMHRNLDSAKVVIPGYLERKLADMMEENPPIEIPYLSDRKQYIYYSHSLLLNKLSYYPYIQLGIILLFIVVAYLAFSSSRKAEQNQVWVGLSKETAHQLGTPISSLLAWLEILKQAGNDPVLMTEFDKDLKRLSKVTDRFSKIGSQPLLELHNIVLVINTSVDYLRSRSSDKIKFEVGAFKENIELPLNPPLFEWVIENVCKNAMDATEGSGKIKVCITEVKNRIQIDFIDNGKGIPKSKQKTIFKPGYTTKARGWGLGLSLTRRIVEEYHRGKIFVAESEVNKGTTIRILLKKS